MEEEQLSNPYLQANLSNFYYKSHLSLCQWFRLPLLLNNFSSSSILRALSLIFIYIIKLCISFPSKDLLPIKSFDILMEYSSYVSIKWNCFFCNL